MVHRGFQRGLQYQDRVVCFTQVPQRFSNSTPQVQVVSIQMLGALCACAVSASGRQDDKYIVFARLLSQLILSHTLAGRSEALRQFQASGVSGVRVKSKEF